MNANRIASSNHARRSAGVASRLIRSASFRFAFQLTGHSSLAACLPGRSIVFTPLTALSPFDDFKRFDVEQILWTARAPLQVNQIRD